MSAPLLYTAQDVARFCEVDLKTIHHWADAGKIPHHRTEGRHLRFRRNHIVQFLRAHGYPLPAELVVARPTIFVALPTTVAVETDDLIKKLSGRFFVRRFDSALSAIVHLVAAQPDALVLSLDDPTWAGAHAIGGLKSDPATAWIVLVVVGTTEEDEGADLVVADLTRIPSELVKRLDVD